MFFDKKRMWQLKKALLSFGETGTSEGTTLIYDGDTLEVGMEVFVDGDEGLVPAHDKVYEVNDQLVTVEGSKVVSIVEKPIEQPVIEEPEDVVEEPVVEEPVETPEEPAGPAEPEEPAEPAEPEEEPEEISKDELQAIIDEQKAIIEQQKAEIAELKAKLNEPAAMSAEEAYKAEKPAEKDGNIDFSKYIKHNRK